MLIVRRSAMRSQHLRKLCIKGCAFARSQRQLATLLSGDERSSAITKLSSSGDPFPWEEEPAGRNAITKTYHFTDFAQAWSWMSKVAVLAEDMNHHPEWKNIYSVVEVTLSTHECGGISELDIAMAEKLDAYAADLLPTRGQGATKTNI